ncbi:MAG TPA: hypothetical protein VK886_17365 [Vicinamibacterales bacterium]|nr:hypothetical protein [Vicinamibacterales bacterium]
MAETNQLAALFSRLARRMRHLSDEELLALIESTTPDAHVEACDRCATRHAELLCVIAELDVIHADADAAFDPERLMHQRTHILRRLDRNNGPARVLPFPAAAAERGMSMVGAAGRRWVAAAAIGGLVVGIFSGRLLTHRAGDPTTVARQGQPSALSRPAGAPAIVPADLRPGVDEVLLAEVDAALSQPGISELSAIDAITPAAR